MKAVNTMKSPFFAKRMTFVLALALFLPGLHANDKSEMVKSIRIKGDQYWDAAKKIWNWAEPGYQESKSSAQLQSILKDAGFDVQGGVAEIPTANPA